MCPTSRQPSSRHATARLALAGLLLCALSAHAQMVPRAAHAMRQGQSFGQTSSHTSGITAVRIGWAGESASDDGASQGLALKEHGRWPQWEGRVGIAMDRPINPVRDSFVLTQPAQAGFRLRSMHVLSDYYVGDGFRATVGLVSGEAGQAWWSSGDNGGGLNLSLQQIDNLGAPIGLGRQRGLTLPQANAYVGAGYSSRLNNHKSSEVWRLNADVGMLNTNTASASRFYGVVQGDRSLDDAVRSLRMRPVIKLSLGYAF